MVDDVAKLRSKAELHSFRYVKRLVDAQIEVVGARGEKCIATEVREGTGAGLYVLRCSPTRQRIGYIGNRMTSQACCVCGVASVGAEQRARRGARTADAGGINNCPVARGIAI